MRRPFKLQFIQTEDTKLGGLDPKGIGEAPFVCKTNGDNPYCIANEMISARIGTFLGVKIPACEIVDLPKAKTAWFASFDYNPGRADLPPVDGYSCVKKCTRLAAGMTIFDILIANPDRHADNLRFDPRLDPPLIAIDHGHAIFGSNLNPPKVHMERIGLSLGIGEDIKQHCLIEHFTNPHDFQEWLDNVRAIPDFVISNACSEVASTLPRKADAKLAVDFLKLRRDNIFQIVNDNQNHFTGIGAWTLLMPAGI